MNGTERKKRSRIAERLGLVAAPRGFVAPDKVPAIARMIKDANAEIEFIMKEGSKK